jgi:MFS family permease
MGRPIWVSVDKLATGIVNENIRGSLSTLKFFVAPLIAAIIAGRVGEKRLHSFFGVFLTSLVSMTVSIILMFYSGSYQLIITGVTLGYGALFLVVGGSLLNGLIFGLIAFITTKRK